MRDGGLWGVLEGGLALRRGLGILGGGRYDEEA